MDPYIGEIRMFAGNFAPVGWAFCQGQILSISEYDALFALLGTTYGGDGQTTFALPDLRGRIPLHAGQNPATGSTYALGQMSGTETVTLTAQQIPAHTHTVQAVAGTGDQASPANGLWATSSLNEYSNQGANAAMAANAVFAAGGSQPHDNMMPYQCINFIIATEGLWPPQN